MMIMMVMIIIMMTSLLDWNIYSRETNNQSNKKRKPMEVNDDMATLLRRRIMATWWEPPGAIDTFAQLMAAIVSCHWWIHNKSGAIQTVAISMLVISIFIDKRCQDGRLSAVPWPSLPTLPLPPETPEDPAQIKRTKDAGNIIWHRRWNTCTGLSSAIQWSHERIRWLLIIPVRLLYFWVCSAQLFWLERGCKPQKSRAEY